MNNAFSPTATLKVLGIFCPTESTIARTSKRCLGAFKNFNSMYRPFQALKLPLSLPIQLQYVKDNFGPGFAEVFAVSISIHSSLRVLSVAST